MLDLGSDRKLSSESETCSHLLDISNSLSEESPEKLYEIALNNLHLRNEEDLTVPPSKMLRKLLD